jgi:hypothetical protein
VTALAVSKGCDEFCAVMAVSNFELETAHAVTKWWRIFVYCHALTM